MARALIQTANQSVQTVADNSIISLGSVQRRYGCNCRLSGNAIEIVGEGYFMVDVSVSVSPTEAGQVEIALYENGLPLPSAVAYGTTSAVGQYVTLPIITTVRKMCCDTADTLTVVLVNGAGEVTNISVRVEKA